MSASNMWALIGNIGANVRTYPEGSDEPTVVDFSLAVNEWRYNPETKENEDMTEWFNIKAYGFVAKRIVRFVEKGRKIHLVGRAYLDSYEKDGVTFKTSGMEVHDFTLLGGGGGSASESQDVESEIVDEEFPF